MYTRGGPEHRFGTLWLSQGVLEAQAEPEEEALYYTVVYEYIVYSILVHVHIYIYIYHHYHSISLYGI